MVFLGAEVYLFTYCLSAAVSITYCHGAPVYRYGILQYPVYFNTSIFFPKPDQGYKLDVATKIETVEFIRRELSLRPPHTCYGGRHGRCRVLGLLCATGRVVRRCLLFHVLLSLCDVCSPLKTSCHVQWLFCV